MRVLISSTSCFWLTREAVLRARDLGAEWASPEHTPLKEELDRAFHRREERYAVLPDMPRHDPILIKIYDELGPSMGSEDADIHCVEIPDDVSYSINSYNCEWIEEQHRVWHTDTDYAGTPSSDYLFNKDSVFNRKP